MKRKIAVVCASNPGSLGMYSVDLGAVDFLSRNGFTFDLFTSHTPSRRGRYRLLRIGLDIGFERRGKFGDLTFRRFSELKQLRSYSHVLYWGDFTPNPIYGYEDFHRCDMRFNVGSTSSESLNKWARLFNLSGGRIPPCTIAVGNNFQHDYSANQSLYAGYLRNLGESFDCIVPRDTFSVENLKKNLPSHTVRKVFPGLDPAFLMNGELRDPGAVKSGFFVYRFARSRLSSPQEFLGRIEERTGCRGIHLKHWDKVGASEAGSIFDKYVSDIRRARFVVTDLYHLAINAIRLNVPVFCIGNPVESQHGTLGDFKKKVLFSMLGLSSYYIEQDVETADHWDSMLQLITSEIASYEGSLSEIYGRANRLASDFESKLLDLIGGCH